VTAEGFSEGEVWLGKLAAQQNISGLVVKLRREGHAPDADHTRLVGTVTREGRPISLGRVGAWWQRDEFDRVNSGVQRGRTVPSPRFEVLHVPLRPDGSYALNDLKIRMGNPGRWFVVVEEPGHAPAVFGPLPLNTGKAQQTMNLDAGEGGSIAGRVENVPASMAGQVWVVAFNENVIRREARVSRDGTFRLDGLPPGRYGLKVGHDAYKDPHILEVPPIGQERTPQQRALEEKSRALAGGCRGDRPRPRDDLRDRPRLPSPQSGHRTMRAGSADEEAGSTREGRRF
jgi:hypothetical protein